MAAYLIRDSQFWAAYFGSHKDSTAGNGSEKERPWDSAGRHEVMHISETASSGREMLPSREGLGALGDALDKHVATAIFFRLALLAPWDGITASRLYVLVYFLASAVIECRLYRSDTSWLSHGGVMKCIMAIRNNNSAC